MRLIFLGKPGSGKGTQARRIAGHVRVPAVSTGELIRQAIAGGSPLGQQFASYTEQGLLVPDTLVLALIEERFAQPDCRSGFLLDGFPRTLVQARALDAWLAARKIPLDVTVNLRVPDSALIARADGRRMCMACGASFHVRFAQPKVEDRCDTCGQPLAQRADDHADVVLRRIGEYRDKTAPLLQFYQAQHLLRDVDGVGSPDEVTQRILAAIEQDEVKTHR